MTTRDGDTPNRPYGPSLPVRAGALVAAVALTATGCAANEPTWLAYGRQAMVASDHPAASRIGADVLRAGGNAVDAAVAVSLALAVTRPQSTGLGGGGFLIMRFADSGAVAVFDYRERAPAAASADMFERAVAAQPDRAPPSRYGHLAVAVPGQLAGLAAVRQQYGTRSWKELAGPAIRLAEEGFPVDRHYVAATRSALAQYKRYPELVGSCPYVYDVHLRRGDPRGVGDTLCQPQLARLLRLIAEHGPDAFYRGPVAEALAREMGAHGGLITAGDLASYEVARRQPLRSTYRGYEIIAMPPPSSGGACLIEILNILEPFDLPTWGRSDRGRAAHYVVEAMKHAFADRARWMGDADFVPVPTALLTAKPYAHTLAGAIKDDATAPSETYGAAQVPDDAGTSHFCIVDPWGNCVVSTETVNTEFGSLAAVGEFGLILNNEMDDFTAHPGKANAFDLHQSVRNAVAPRKRPLSSMSPTIVLADGQPALLIGASGGPRIITSVLDVMLGVLDFGQSLEEAMTACRIHHQWQPDEISFDRAPPAEMAAGLQSRGHVLGSHRETGIVQAIQRTPAGWCGASDPRKEGSPSGY